MAIENYICPCGHHAIVFDAINGFVPLWCIAHSAFLFFEDQHVVENPSGVESIFDISMPQRR